MILLYRFQIFSQRFSGYCHHIQIQIFFQKQLYFRNSSCKPEGLGEMLAAGIYVSYMRNVCIDFIKKPGIQFHAEFCGNGRQMEQGIGGASYGAVNHNGIAKGGRCKDLGRADIFCRKLHNFTPGIPRHGQNIPHGRRRQRASRKGESQRFRHTLHGARCSHKGACSLGRAACQFIITDFIRRNFVVSFLSQ